MPTPFVVLFFQRKPPSSKDPVPDDWDAEDDSNNVRPSADSSKKLWEDALVDVYLLFSFTLSRIISSRQKLPRSSYPGSLDIWLSILGSNTTLRRNQHPPNNPQATRRSRLLEFDILFRRCYAEDHAGTGSVVPSCSGQDFWRNFGYPTDCRFSRKQQQRRHHPNSTRSADCR